MCEREAERKLRLLAEEETHTGAATAFQYCVLPLASVSPLTSMGRVLSASEDAWTAVILNMRKEWRKWHRTSRILVSEEADTSTYGTL